ncbi:uncharacterized protein [Cicer arietinum]|uniref:Uncharacterized protein LOC101514532 n=1 Tax=Cicer arietinum TaxID=3827 RepID=A0A1S2YY78_CICAR|nr:uncharacterized protein LOC101514532 [Cicer arietinum]
MNRDERKRRFNEAIVNILYPPPPQDLEPIELGSCSNVISDTFYDSENASTTESEEKHESETEKLTRAQRKRIRKKKMKQEAILRGKLIGPLMPPTQTTQCEDDDALQAVRSNASQEGDETTCANSKKMKRRRMAKRMAKEKRVASAFEKCNQSSISSDAVIDLKDSHT